MRQAQSVFNSSTEIINHYQHPPRLFVGLNGSSYIADHLGTRLASSLALVLLASPSRRVIGFRDGEAANG